MLFVQVYAFSCLSRVYSLLLQLYGFVSFDTQLRLILFIYWPSPLLFNKLLIVVDRDRDRDRDRDCDRDRECDRATVSMTVTMNVYEKNEQLSYEFWCLRKQELATE
jgi:hypothetical protein